MRIRVPPQVCSTSSGCAAMARMSSGFSMAADPVSISCHMLIAPGPGALHARHQHDEQPAGGEPAHVRAPRHAAVRHLRITHRADATEELNGEPIKEQEERGNVDGGNENED